MIKMHKYTIVIEDISEGKQEAFVAKIFGTKYEHVEAMADTIPELFESIKLTLEEVNS